MIRDVKFQVGGGHKMTGDVKFQVGRVKNLTDFSNSELMEAIKRSWMSISRLVEAKI